MLTVKMPFSFQNIRKANTLQRNAYILEYLHNNHVWRLDEQHAAQNNYDSSGWSSLSKMLSFASRGQRLVTYDGSKSRLNLQEEPLA